MFPDISDLNDQVFSIMPTALTGSVVRTMGMTVAIADFPAPIGAIVEVQPQAGAAVRGEVVGFRDDLTLVYPFGRLDGIRRGNRARLVCTSRFLRVGQAVLGRILDAHGNCVDGLPQPHNHHRAGLDRSPPTPTERPPINQTLVTGVRSIDGLLTCGLGQRIGIFSGSGVGKSMTLGMIARYTTADVIVIALIGERGREVNEFIQRDLGKEGLARAVIVVATADEPAILRVQSALTATSVAEHFRDQGKKRFVIDGLDYPDLQWPNVKLDSRQVSRRQPTVTLHPYSAYSQDLSNGPAVAQREASQHYIQSLSRVTTLTSRSATPSEDYWMDMLYFLASLQCVVTILLSTF